MDRIKDFGENLRENVSNIKMPSPEDIRQNAMNTVNNTMDAVDSVKNNVNNSLNQFSSQSSVYGEQSFLNSNSIIAKFAFVIFAVIIFIVLLYLGTKLVFYLLTPPDNPYVVKGVLAGNSAMVISQKPDDSNSIIIKRSNDQKGGLEYTWSVWLFISDVVLADGTKFDHIFNKGTNDFHSNTNKAGSNGPGMYVSFDSTSKSIGLSIFVDTDTVQEINITNVPIKKWFNVILRMQNTVADVYINGSIAGRKVFGSTPLQNNYDILIGHSSGFRGNLSDLRYYNYALNIFDINNIILFGPNLSPSASSPDATSKNTSYISSTWYNSKLS